MAHILRSSLRVRDLRVRKTRLASLSSHTEGSQPVVVLLLLLTDLCRVGIQTERQNKGSQEAEPQAHLLSLPAYATHWVQCPVDACLTFKSVELPCPLVLHCLASLLASCGSFKHSPLNAGVACDSDDVDGSFPEANTHYAAR